MSQPKKHERVKINTSSALGASSYNSPFSHTLAESQDPRIEQAQAQLRSIQSSLDPYAEARTKVLSMALAQGYDPTSMLERGVVWAEDQDPFGHITNSSYPQFLSQCNYRVMESFERFIGRDNVDRMRRGKGICPLVRGYEISLRRVVEYPDSLIVANKLTDQKPDRYYGVTTIWSLKQQVPVAECRGWITWFDFDTGKAADLVQKGGIWKDLYFGLENVINEGKAREAELEGQKL